MTKKKPTAKRKPAARKKAAAKRKPAKKDALDPIPANLNYRLELFCQEYATGEHAGNGTQSAIAAGYSEKSAKEIAYEHLTKPHVKSRVRELQAERLNRLRVTNDRILEKTADLAFSNMQDCYDENGDLIPPNKLPRHIASALKEVTHDVRRVGEVEVTKISYKLADNKSAIELLMKERAMLTDVVKHNHTMGLQHIESEYVDA